jgi:hypothetical protein
MKLSKKKFFSLLAVTVLAVTVFAPAAMAAASDALPGNLASSATIDTDYIYTTATKILQVMSDIEITGDFSEPITLEIEDTKTVTWKATTSGNAGTEDLITISDDSGDSSVFMVVLGTSGSLAHEGSVLVNYSKAAVKILGGTLKSTAATGDFITLYSEGDVTIDSSAAAVTIESASGNAVHVKDADISIASDGTNQLTIKTEAAGFAAIYAAGAGNVTVTGADTAVTKTQITASGGDNAAIYNEKGNVTVTDATIEVEDADSAGVYAQDGDVIIDGAVIDASGGEDCVGVYVRKGDVTVSGTNGTAQILADDNGGVAVFVREGDVTLNTAVLSANDGGPVVEARKGNVTVAAGVTVYAGSGTGTAIRASGTITDNGANITGKQLSNYNYNPSGGSSGGCDAGFGGLFGILALAGTALIRGKR